MEHLRGILIRGVDSKNTNRRWSVVHERYALFATELLSLALFHNSHQSSSSKTLRALLDEQALHPFVAVQLSSTMAIFLSRDGSSVSDRHYCVISSTFETGILITHLFPTPFIPSGRPLTNSARRYGAAVCTEDPPCFPKILTAVLV